MTGNAQVTRVKNALLTLTVLAIPLNGLRPLANVGELQMEGAFYVSLAYCLVSLLTLTRKGGWSAFHDLLIAQRAYLFVILASAIVCLPTILGNEYGDRTGPERYALSLLTYGYFIFLAGMIVVHAREIGERRFMTVASRAFIILAWGLSVLGLWEIASWFVPPMQDALVEFRSLFSTSPAIRPFRLSGVSLEPSFCAIALLACLPWTYLRARERGARYKVLTVVLVVLCVLSGSRTAYVSLVVLGAGYLALRGTFRSMLPKGWDGAALVAIIFALGIAAPLLAYELIDADQAVSNVTRGYLTASAVRAGLDSLVGQGFGQVAFYVVRDPSSLVQYSWELMSFYEGDRYGELPPLFSWYARTFGEFGPVGYSVVAASFAAIAKRLFDPRRVSGRHQRPRIVSIFMLLTFLSVAFSIESLRVPQYWLIWPFFLLAGTEGRQLARWQEKRVKVHELHA